MQESISIVLSGEAGQGLQTIEELLVEAIAQSYYVFSTKDVMSRIRGGNNTVQIRMSDSRIYACRHTIDYLFLLNDNAFERLVDRVTDRTIIFGEEGFVEPSLIQEKKATYETLNVRELAKEYGVLYSNTVLFGFLVGMLQLDREFCQQQLQVRFESKSEKILSHNLHAFAKGFEAGSGYKNNRPLKKTVEASTYKISDGTSSVGIGALAGGCNFVATYPMSPGTGVLTYLAKKSKEFDVVVEQAEDEIAALNMVIGSWYAGARGLTTTSGGGFALMVEAVSLAGITETPCVVHLAQRPGPATGLPTRTEQADLNLAVYAGHGEFPRLIFAPGNLEDAVLLTQKAFYLADKYQVPAFILTDQHLLESMGQMQRLTLDESYLEKNIIETTENYRRYEFNDAGISPRGIPGYGEGFVKADSDEHDESGQITEDFVMRKKMNDKRLHKHTLLLAEYVDAELIGPKEYTKLLVGWGSTCGVLKEYIDTTDCKDVAFLYVKQVFPLHKKLSEYFEQAETIVVVENNATGQFANLLKLELDATVDHKVLKYNGEPYSIEEIMQRIGEVL